MASNYEALTNRIYADMAQRGVTLMHLQDLFDLSLNEIRTGSFDRNAVFKVTGDVKSALSQILANHPDKQLQIMYDKTLLLEAPYLLDSYCLYIEKDRRPDERFYEPRRKTLKKVVDVLQRLEDDEMDEQFIHMPARTGKSQTITMAVAWHCAKNPESSNLYVTYTESVAGAFLDGVKEIWTDQNTYCHYDVFPGMNIVATDSIAHTIDLNRKKKYKSLSAKGLEASLNGAYDCNGWLVVDDILKGIEEVLNPEVLHRKQLLFDNNVMRRKKSGAKVIYNGTIWSLHDIFMDRQRFLEESVDAKHIRYNILKIPALDPVTDESNFDYDYGVGFDTQYYRTERAKFQANEDTAGFLAQFQQEPIERDGAIFSPGGLQYYNGELPEEEPVKIVAVCDVALGGEDFLSMPVAYVYENGDTYIHDVVFDNTEKDITQPQVIEAIIRNDVGSAFFEANQGGEGYKREIDQKLHERKDFNNGNGINIVSKYTPGTQRKAQRIWDSAPMIRTFYFREPHCRNEQYKRFMLNLFSFTITTNKHKHDDAPDSLAMLCAFLKKGSGVRAAKIVHGFI